MALGTGYTIISKCRIFKAANPPKNVPARILAGWLFSDNSTHTEPPRTLGASSQSTLSTCSTVDELQWQMLLNIPPQQRLGPMRNSRTGISVKFCNTIDLCFELFHSIHSFSASIRLLLLRLSGQGWHRTIAKPYSG